MKPTESEVAMGGEGAHAEFHGEFERAPVVVFRFGRIWRIAACIDVAEKEQGPRKTAAKAAVNGEVKARLAAVLASSVRPATR